MKRLERLAAKFSRDWLNTLWGKRDAQATLKEYQYIPGGVLRHLYEDIYCTVYTGKDLTALMNAADRWLER